MWDIFSSMASIGAVGWLVIIGLLVGVVGCFYCCAMQGVNKAVEDAREGLYHQNELADPTTTNTTVAEGTATTPTSVVVASTKTAPRSFSQNTPTAAANPVPAPAAVPAPYDDSVEMDV